MKKDYREFIESKICIDKNRGFDCSPDEVNPLLKPHQRDMVVWAVRGGYRAIFTAFGLGKTIIQLEIMRIILTKIENKKGMALIVLPLGVRQEFIRDAKMLGTFVAFIRTTAEASSPGIYLTNYESVREGKIDPTKFDCCSLDEASILRGFGGTKTFREFMNLFEDSGIPRFVATATPSPNEYIELLAYSAFLDVMDVGQAKTRFFKRDSTKADKLTLHPHKEKEFWLWVSSWAIFVQAPSDLGYSDEGYKLPPLDVRWHEVESDHSKAGNDRDGQGHMFSNAALGVQDASREKRDSLKNRIRKLMQLREEDPTAHRIIWHDLESERAAIEKNVPGVVSVYGSQDLDEREKSIVAFSNGEIRELAGKPCMLGSGCNFQRHCHWAIFLGVGFKFNEFVQAIHRIHRFLQGERVRIDIIYTEAEAEIKAQLERKWRQHDELVANMTTIIKEYGLCEAAKSDVLRRAIGIDRREASGAGWKMANNDCVDETARIEANTLGLILTSIPFATQYEYSPNYCDFGHSESNDSFFRQMDYLTPELYRALTPGRMAAIHVKDRIVPGGMTGLGFQTVFPFHARCIEHYTRHGFAYMGMKTIVTDVVRENNQTYRLGWTEQCKDGSKMGVGMPEYLLLFRKPPTDNSNGYADLPVVKDKARYSRSRWQIDAHGFARSNGNRPITAEDLKDIPHEAIFKLFRRYSLTNIYDFEQHVKLGEALEAEGKLPVTFMLLQPQSWSDEVWTDITRMLTLNGAQYSKGKEMHLCPMQFDLADRVIAQMSNPGEFVYDPFAGLGTVPLRALMQGRYGLGCELSAGYWYDAVSYLRAEESKADTPDLFKLLEETA